MPALVLSILLTCCGADPDAKPTVRHSFFIAGPTFTGIIDEEGKESWNAGRPAARDGYVLPGGNVLIAWSDVVQELTRERKVVFEYRKSPDNAEIGTAERLSLIHISEPTRPY